MNWSDEHYVKLYTRQTLTWRSWGWQARTLFLHLVKCVDGAGFIETGTMSAVDALTIQLELPREVVAFGLDQLIASGTAELVDHALLLPKFVEAQEARKSDGQKKRDYREAEKRRRREAHAQASETTTPTVHRVAPTGTKRDPPSPAQPSPAQPLKEDLSTSSTVVEVFEHWKARVSPKARLDPKRQKLIKARLEHYQSEDLKRAIDGYVSSPFHQGQNDRQQKYLGLELMLRDSEHVEAGWRLLEGPTPRGGSSDADRKWFEENAGKEISF